MPICSLSLKNVTFFMPLVLMLSISGCANFPKTTVPNSHQLEVKDLNAGSAIASAVKKHTPWPSQQWWKVYGDPQLDRLVTEAVVGNPTMGIAQARVAKVLALSEVAGSALLPSLQTDAAFNRQLFSENHFTKAPYAGNWAWNNLAALDLAYNLDLWGKNRSTLSSALDYVEVAKAEAQEVQLSLETAVVRSYVQLSLQCVLRNVAQSTLRQRQEILDITRKRFAAGLSTELDLRQAETPIPAAWAELERISESIELARNQLAALMGKGPGDGETIKRPALLLNVPIQLPDALPADLLGRRPDVTAQRWRVEATGKSIDAAKAAFYPNINLMALTGLQSLGFGQLLSPGSLIASFGPAVSLPIFDGGRLRSQLQATTADYDMAVESYNGTVIRALENVSDQVVSLRSIEKQRKYSAAASTLADRAYDIALQGFRAGFTDYLNVLNAQNQTLVEAQRKAQLDARFLDAHATLMQAIGGGMPVASPPAPGSHQ